MVYIGRWKEVAKSDREVATVLEVMKLDNRRGLTSMELTPGIEAVFGCT